MGGKRPEEKTAKKDRVDDETGRARSRTSAAELRRAGEKIVRPLKAGATRAREFLGALVERSRDRARTLLTRHDDDCADVHAGGPEAFRQALESLERHAAAFDLPVDFSDLRDRLEALLSVLLEISDDRLAGEAACPLAGELAAALERAQAIFVLPEPFFGLLDLDREDLAAVRAALEADEDDRARRELLKHLADKPVPDAVRTRLPGDAERAVAEAGLVTRGFARLPDGCGGSPWRFLSGDMPWRFVHAEGLHEHAETATLALAGHSAGDETLAAATVERILSWAAAVEPPPVSTEAEHAPPAWRPSIAAARLGNFTTSFLALRGARAFTPEVARVLLALVHETAEYLAERPDADADAKNEALSVAGTVFDEFKAAARWRAEGAASTGSGRAVRIRR